MSADHELPFRIVTGSIWLLYFIIRLRFQAQAKNEEIILRHHERRAKLYFRLFAFCYLFLLLYIFPSPFDAAHLPLSETFRWIFGGGSLIVFLSLFTWTHVALGKHWSGFLEIHKNHKLIISGPFRYIRHPMYASFILSGIGFLLLTANWLTGGIYLIVAVLMYVDRVGPEEAMMTQQFGEEYLAYRKRTGRIFPKIVSSRDI